MSTFHRATLLLLLSCSACAGGNTDSTEPDPTSSGGTGAASPIGDGGLESDPAHLPAVSASTRRLTVDMLQASIPVVAGLDLSGNPITWTVDGQNGPVDALSDAAFGATLGRPDYVSVTSEPAEPSALYLKFMDDMARDVCPKILDADYGRADASARTLLRHVDLDTLSDGAAIRTNLQYLKRRFHADMAPEEAELTQLKVLFDAGVSEASGSDSDKARAGWQGVCVALFLAPAFHIY